VAYYDSIIEEVTSDLTTELKNEPTFDAEILACKVKNAVNEIIRRRNIDGSKLTTDADKEKDIRRFIVNIHNVALYDYNQIGIEGQTSSTEASTTRTYVNRESLSFGVFPYV
jgi:intein-encoded DNA endonuclease-like protein